MSSAPAPAPAPRARLLALACPACGGGLDVAGSTLLDCSSCGTPLSVRTPDGVARFSVLPRVGGEQAMALARACWAGQGVAPGFLSRAAVDAPRLLFLAFYEAERSAIAGTGRGSVLVEARQHAPAVDVPGVPVAALDRAVLADASRHVPFDPRLLQARGLVFDPALPPRQALPHDPRTELLEERLTVVDLPMWVVRCREGRSVYDAAVDATTGALLGARAPADRTARLPQTIGSLYLLALVPAFVLVLGGDVVRTLLQLHEVGLAVGGLALAALAWLVAWAWDRIRFRYEVVHEGTSRRLEPINRPVRTAPEKVRDVLIRMSVSLLRRRRR